MPITKDSIRSAILKENRPLEIILPAGYDPKSGTRYDVIYVTDGEWNTRIVSDMQLFLGYQFIPPNIIVSIPNVYPNNENQRGRDFTPTHTDGSPNSGGAENFLAFLKTELTPYITNKYKTNGENTFYGSSLGGLFGIYALCKEPALFQSWLLADPALWWDNNYVPKLLKENIARIGELRETLLVTAREGAAYQYMGIASLDTILKAAALTHLHWKTLQYNDETHNSMIFRTVYDGLKFTYAGYSKEELVFHPMNGMLLKDKPITVQFNTELLKNIRFTTDGTEPSDSATQIIGDTLRFNGPAVLKIKSISNRARYSKTTTGHFTVGVALPAVAKEKNTRAGGWQYKYYEADRDSSPDTKKLKPLQTGMADKLFDLEKLPRKEHFTCIMEGQLEIRTDGYYVFGIKANGDAKLSLNKQVLINDEQKNSGGDFQSFVVPLTKGFYPVKLDYIQKKGNPELKLVYILPGTNNPVPVPFELQYSHAKR